VSQRINPPHWQPGPLAFAVLGVVGFAYAGYALAISTVGTNPWWAAITMLALMVPIFVFILGGWLWIQRQVEIADGRITVTRWLNVLRGRTARPIPLDGRTRIAIVTNGGRQLQIEREGTLEVNCTLLYWGPSALRTLLDSFRMAGIEISTSWEGEYPPWAN
jgi:hypothetical protein